MDCWCDRLLALVLMCASLLLLCPGNVQGKLVLQGPKDGAELIGENAVFICDLVAYGPEENGTVVNQPYNITWVFRPYNMGDLVSMVMTSIHQGNREFTSLTPEPDKYENIQGPHLHIRKVALSDAGWYQCTSNLTQDSVGAHLMVIDHPQCHNERSDVYYHENISLECLVRYNGHKHPLVDWRYGSERLNSSSETEENSTTLRERLVLEASERVQGHVYHCYVYYPGLKSVQCMSLPPIHVYSPAKVESVTAYPVTEENEYLPEAIVQLRCLATGYPVPTFSWAFTSAVTGKKREAISSTSQVVISGLTEDQTGLYECTVTNEIIRKQKDGSSSVETFTDVSSTNLSMADPSKVPEMDQPNAAYIIRNPGSPQLADTSMTFSPYAIGAVISAGLAVLLIIGFVLMSMRMKRRERRMREKIARAHDENLDDQEVELLEESTQPNAEYLPTEYSRLKMSWEIPRKDVRLLEQISQGAFVEVWKGRMRRSPGSTEVMRVIIKKLQGEASDKERHFFSAELEVLKMLPAHANVIRLVGSYTANEPWLMMIEQASEGSLQQFLHRHRPGHQQQQVMISRGEKQSVSMKKQVLTSQKLLALAAQVASGLDHLDKFKLIYYRLRSCKILVAKGGICKLSGFGFANEITDRNIYESNSTPVRWAAPESLQSSVYNVKTDTWAYGIVAWEILHFGTTPYPTMGPHEVVASVQTGFRMPKPQHCSSELYELLLRCWHTIPEERPSYQEILELLSHFVVNADVHIDLTGLPDHLLSLDTGDLQGPTF